MHALFFFFAAAALCRSSLGSRSTSRSHGVVLLEDRSAVRSGRSLVRTVARFVGLSVVVNNKMFCFNHIVASSYAYALAEGEGDRRAWDSFSISISFTFYLCLCLYLLPLASTSTPTSSHAALFSALFLFFFVSAAFARSSLLWAELVVIVVVFAL